MTSKYRVLVADDEERIRTIVRMYLEKDGACVEEADNGNDALHKAVDNDYDIIVLDWMMPGLSGLEICQLVKQVKTTPLLMLTAKDNEDDTIHAFQAGVDDYVTKPFSPREFTCRIQAILKRTQPGKFWSATRSPGNRFMLPHLLIEHDARRVLADGREISFTLREYELLRYLVMNEGITCTRDKLFRDVWGYEDHGDHRTVDSHVKRVREKLQAVSPAAAAMIGTVWGIGYRLKASNI
ncbi:response regulator transcription factor [Paenibacillus periandrae]|uniref:response regulator transcription factor n=1 Tax=Paenibacillus periandrae TaxID=1761741 RepID=UPI001F08FFAC|nr:response regulator transcription factor [Paenibacillus periandrae]